MTTTVDDKKWIEWRPMWAEHVIGRYEPRQYDHETRTAYPQLITMDCEKCSAHFQFVCTSGAVRSRISKFAILHLHRDGFEISPGLTP